MKRIPGAPGGGRVRLKLLILAVMLTGIVPVAFSSTEYPLEPPDRSSPRATLATFLDSVNRAWDLYSAHDSGFAEPFRRARGSLDLSEVPPLVAQEVSAKTALMLKDVLDRLELPPQKDIPDARQVVELDLTRWTIPHTEITLVRVAKGEREGEWLFSARTVARTQEFYDKVRSLPYRPGKTGGHVEELRAASQAAVFLRFVQVLPPVFQREVGGMFAWQWLGLALLVGLMATGVAAVAWLGHRWRRSALPGYRLGELLVPAALVSVPVVGKLMLRRLFELPGPPALTLRLVFSVVGYAGLAWLVALVVTHLGDLVVRLWFEGARPLKKQLVRVIFRIATIVVVTGVALKALQLLGAPVTGLIAGLGVGGLAIALAAQGTLENFIGGIILYADQPVKIGDICRFSDRRGIIEDVGLRSVRIRTLDRTIVTIPNADFAKMQLENLSDRDRVLLREEIRLRYETTRAQLTAVLTGIRTMLQEHPRIDEDRLRVRFTGFGDHFLRLEIFAYALTTSRPEFLEIREDVLLKVMEVIERSGTRLALPTEIHYSVRSEDPGNGRDAVSGSSTGNT